MELVLVGPSAIVTVTLVPGRRVVIGRGDDVDVTIDDRRVSRAHAAVLSSETEGTTLEDLGSRNGTVLDAERLTARQAAAWSPDATCVLGNHVGWLEAERVGPRWMAVTAFEEEVARPARPVVDGERRLVFEVRTRMSASTETNLHGLHAAANEEIALLGALRALLRARSAEARRRDGAARALVTRRPNGAILVACREADAPMLLDGHGDAHAFDFVARPLPPPRDQRASRSGTSVVAAAPNDGTLDLERVAQSDVTVLVLGETGSGKELAARDLHARSTRSRGRFVVVNCASIAESLFETELFGHEKGAFTGAFATRRGYLESADGGTLFLDEIAELPKQHQAKLLRVFEDRSIQRVGGVEPRPIDVRFVAATHRDLAEEVAKGRFRDDLYFRLCGVVLRIPPLRERPGELRRLTGELLAQLTTEAVAVSDDAFEALLAHPWPGNVRELRAVLERALLMRTGPTIEPGHLVFEFPSVGSLTRDDVGALIAAAADGGERRERVRAALEAAHGNQTKASALLGVSRRTLTNWLNELGLPRPRKGTGP